MSATFRTSAAGGSSSGSNDRTVVITPAVGDLLVVFCNVDTNTNTTPTCSDNNGSGTYNRILTALRGTSAHTMSVFVRTALMVNTTSTTITVATGSNSSGSVVVVAVSGMQKVGSAAILKSGKQENQATSTTPAPALASAARAQNMIISAVANATNPAGTTSPAGSSPTWNLANDTGQTANPEGLKVVYANLGFSGTTLTWGGTSASAFSSAVLELDASITPVVGALAIGPVVGPPNGGDAPRMDLGITPLVGSLALAGAAPSLLTDTIMVPAAGALEGTGVAPTVAVSDLITLTPDAGALTLVGIEPTVGLGASNTDLTPSAGALTLTGVAPAGVQSTVLTPGQVLRQVASDTFTRADSTDLGADWTPWTRVGFSAAQIVSNHVTTPIGGSRLCVEIRGDVLGNDQYAQLTMLAVPATLDFKTGVYVRGSSPSLPAEGNGYALLVESISSVRTLTIYKVATAVLTSLASITESFGTGDVLRLEVEGTTLRGYVNGVQRLVTTDATYAGGFTAIRVQISLGAVDDVQVDNFSCGEFGLALTGVASAVSTGTILQPAVGALVLAGVAPTVQEGGGGVTNTNLTPAVGALSLVGIASEIEPLSSLILYGYAPILLVGTNLQPAVGSLTLTGVAPTVAEGGGGVTDTPLTPSAGALVLTGAAPSMDLSIRPNVGTLTFTGMAPTVVATDHATLTPAAGALTLTGVAPRMDLSIRPDAGVLVLAGVAPRMALVITPGTGSLTLAGETSGVPQGTVRTPAAGALTLTGITAVIEPLSSLILYGYAPILLVGTILIPNAGALVLEGSVPTVQPSAENTLIPATGALVLAGQTPTVIGTAHALLTPETGTLTLTGQTPVVVTGTIITPAVGALTLTGATPVTIVATLVTPAVGTLVLTGVAPAVSTDVRWQPSAGELVLAGVAPAVSTDLRLTPAVGALVFTGTIPTVDVSSQISRTPDTGALVFTGYAPSVIVTGGVASGGPYIPIYRRRRR